MISIFKPIYIVQSLILQRKKESKPLHHQIYSIPKTYFGFLSLGQKVGGGIIEDCLDSPVRSQEVEYELQINNIDW